MNLATSIADKKKVDVTSAKIAFSKNISIKDGLDAVIQWDLLFSIFPYSNFVSVYLLFLHANFIFIQWNNYLRVF